MKLICLLIFNLFFISTKAQTIQDSLVKKEPNFSVTYQKPKPFSFVTQLPKDLYGFTKQSFQKRNLKYVGYVALGTVATLFIDDKVYKNVRDFSNHNNIQAKESNNILLQIKLGGKKTNFIKIPRNVNTTFYNLGQGSATMMIAAGMFAWGKIKKDNRALQTASQLTESFLALGVSTQILKWASGRENPSDATMPGGRWSPFPPYSKFQNQKPKYDAFPSGHLATFMSTVTILAENYPKKRWIRPVGYTLAGLLGLSMINNGVHWMSDFPLGVAMGYGFGKYLSKKHRHFTLI